MQDDLIIAREYATAVFNIAIKNNSFIQWKIFLKKLLVVSQIKDVNQFLNIIYPDNIILKIFLLFYTTDIDIQNKNFIKLLIMRQRLYLIKNIFKQFIKLYNDYHNIMDVELITVDILSIKQKEKISMILSKKFNKKINLICKVDTTILYGVIVRYNNFVIDNCIFSCLYKLSNFLIS